MNKKILKERNGKMRNSKGITLVALIITIVVLLILAAIAIGAVRDSNIIGHAQNAAGGYNQAKANELETLAKSETEIEKYLPKDRTYATSGGEMSITLTVDNQIILSQGTQQMPCGAFSYIDVTKEVLAEIDIDGMSYNTIDYSRAIKFKMDGDDVVGVLSKDENTLYIGEVVLTLVETINKPTEAKYNVYGTEEFYYILTENKIVVVYGNNFSGTTPIRSTSSIDMNNYPGYKVTHATEGYSSRIL